MGARSSRRGWLAVAVVLGAVGAAGTAPRASADGPSVTVRPRYGLAAGAVVDVTATGLPPSTEVVVSQCAQDPDLSVPIGCTNRQSMTTNPTGTLDTTWTLQDPVYYQHEFGDPTPQYCRADICRIYVSIPDGGSGIHVVSPVLWFPGSPATIAASVTTGLVDQQRIFVSGSAKGSPGRTVRLVQQECFSIIQGHGCFGEITLATVQLGHHDTFATHLRVRRYLADGTDCVQPIFDFDPCRITAVIIGPDGQPDESFGATSFGDPGVSLTFAAP